MPKFDLGAAAARRNETRLNRQTYEFILKNQLFNLDGQLALFDRGVESISFPPGSKEIKAQWREIKEQDKSRYHWIRKAENLWPYGCTSPQDVPNWFWATVEHADNPKPTTGLAADRAQLGVQRPPAGKHEPERNRL